MDESLPELFLFTPGVKSLLFFCQVIFDFLKPTNKNTADLLVLYSARWGCGEQGEVVSRQWPSACSAAARAPCYQEPRVGTCAKHLKAGRSFKECPFFLNSSSTHPRALRYWTSKALGLQWIAFIFASGSDLVKANSCMHNMIDHVTPQSLFQSYHLIHFL